MIAILGLWYYQYYYNEVQNTNGWTNIRMYHENIDCSGGARIVEVRGDHQSFVYHMQDLNCVL